MRGGGDLVPRISPQYLHFTFITKPLTNTRVCYWQRVRLTDFKTSSFPFFFFFFFFFFRNSLLVRQHLNKIKSVAVETEDPTSQKLRPAFGHDKGS